MLAEGSALGIDLTQLGKLQAGLEQAQDWLGKATELSTQPVLLLQLQRIVRSSRELFVLVEEVQVYTHYTLHAPYTHYTLHDRYPIPHTPYTIHCTNTMR